MVLNTGISSAGERAPGYVPLVLNGPGQNNNIEFKYEEETEVYGSCGLKWKNQMYIIGGHYRTRQLSKIHRCKLKSLGQLPFVARWTACTNVNDKLVFVCFSEHWNNKVELKRCRVATNPKKLLSKMDIQKNEDNIYLIKNSRYEHFLTRIASSKSNSRAYFQIFNLILS